MRDSSTWGPRHASEPTHPKTYDVAEMLGIHPMQAYGHIGAFRARILTEAPTGILRGRARQVEDLAKWDGTPGALAEAFVRFRIVDVDADGFWVAHEHPLYGGASMKARDAACRRTQKWRDAQQKKWAEAERAGAPVTVTSQVTSPLLSVDTHLSSALSSSSSSSDPDQTRARPARPSGPRPRPRGAFGLEEQGRKPKTASDLLNRHRALFAERFTAYDGAGGRLSALEKCEALFIAYSERFDATGEQDADARFKQWLSDDHAKVSLARERAGGAPATPPPPTGPAPKMDPAFWGDT